MADINVSLTITNQLHKDGVAYAMALRNSSLAAEVQDKNEDGSPKVDADGKPVMIANPEIITDPAAYVTFVGASAVKSYARQKIEADFQAGTINKTQRDVALADPSLP